MLKISMNIFSKIFKNDVLANTIFHFQLIKYSKKNICIIIIKCMVKSILYSIQISHSKHYVIIHIRSNHIRTITFIQFSFFISFQF